MRRFWIASLALVLFLGGAAAYTSANAATGKVTICHAAGRDGTTKFIEFTLSENAVYKPQGGHFYENGTPRAGHEDDYFGECEGPHETTTTTTAPTTTTVPSTTTTVSPTTTVPSTPTTAPPVLVPPTVITPPLTPEPVPFTPGYTG